MVCSYRGLSSSANARGEEKDAPPAWFTADTQHNTQQFGQANAALAGDLALSGLAQGLSATGSLGPGAQGIVGVVTDTTVNALTRAAPAVSILGTASEVTVEGLAGPIGWAKLGVDLAIFGGSAIACSIHR